MKPCLGFNFTDCLEVLGDLADTLLVEGGYLTGACECARMHVVTRACVRACMCVCACVRERVLGDLADKLRVDRRTHREEKREMPGGGPKV